MKSLCEAPEKTSAVRYPKPPSFGYLLPRTQAVWGQDPQDKIKTKPTVVHRKSQPLVPGSVLIIPDV